MRATFIGVGVFMVLGALGALNGGDGRAFLTCAGLAAGAFFVASKVKVTYTRDVAVGPRKKHEHF